MSTNIKRNFSKILLIGISMSSLLVSAQVAEKFQTTVSGSQAQKLFNELNPAIVTLAKESNNLAGQGETVRSIRTGDGSYISCTNWKVEGYQCLITVRGIVAQ